MGAMIVDTDVLSDFLRGRQEAVDAVERHSQERPIATTDINVFELYYGAFKSEKSERNVSKLKGFLNTIPVRSTSGDSMETAGRMAAEQEERGERVGVKDVLIGSIASLEDEPVLTRNVDEFQRLEGVELLEP
ncbi:MAG: type II toxin-antitoxin system VapC family toxin [Candidatus Nanohaloarchaea archaeon]|nr:type II toxin-antitoxin system VapC family toxin [Candidatus Nanohaloarchaea archaeon]